MAFGYFLSHAPRNFFPALNGGDAAILYCFVFLYIAAVGGGIWSLDHARERGGPGTKQQNGTA
jgi:putative oxidoreductase